MNLHKNTLTGLTYVSNFSIVEPRNDSLCKIHKEESVRKDKDVPIQTIDVKNF
jgi:hypothetical protein